ncbi:dTDP-glucose 4,6-dehydratase [Dongia deserti]|uniref:dTDP-glucose 4,6-dehydratase n=1 Tax=Dongia deserti TaxID=2268030 RepID=UPI000E64A23D|nr:dTDP-glucose 4,6-dehydratase [Dongia deserti]
MTVQRTSLTDHDLRLALGQRTVLVTGGAGFIGSAVCRLLQDLTACRIVNLDKLSYASSPAALELLGRDSRYTFEQVDLCDRSALAGVFQRHRPDAVIHLAAESHVDRSIDGPQAFIMSNVVGTFNLLEACRAHLAELSDSARAAFRLVHVSTDEVYGSLGNDGQFDEQSRYDPRSPYSASKAASDHLAAAWRHTFGVPTLITNCGNNYGPFQFPEKFIPTLIIRAMKGQELPIYGGGTNVRDWIHVEDHARALLGVLAFGTVGGKYLIGAEEQRRNLDLAEMICDLIDRMVPRNQPSRSLLTHVVDRPGHDHRYAIDPSKVRAEIGWRPQRSLADGLESTVQWYIDHKEWWESIFRSGRYGGERLGLDQRRVAEA